MFQNSQNALEEFMFITTKYFESFKPYLKHSNELLEEHSCNAFRETLLQSLKRNLAATLDHRTVVMIN
jgi:hypothetical protein